MKAFPVLAVALAGGAVAVSPSVRSHHGVTYVGTSNNGIDKFLSIPYGQDTSGKYRFAPPRPYTPQPGSTIRATAPGPACPQALGGSSSPFPGGNITAISEDCLHLNVVRPNGTRADSKLPVMVWIHGGEYQPRKSMRDKLLTDNRRLLDRLGR
jgi:carboxylesterase type B